MTWGRAERVDSQDAGVTDCQAFFVSKRRRDIDGTALTTSRTAKPHILPPFLLTSLHRKAAHLMDRDKAILRRDMRAVHREEAALARLTREILGRGA